MTQILEQLEINQTFFIQFALFGAFFLILSSIYLKPFQKLLEKRNHKLKDDVQSATDLLKAVEVKLADYERAIAASRNEARLGYEAAMTDARAKEDAVVNQIKDELKKDYAKITQQLQEDKAKVESELKGQVAQMADTVANQILGK